MPDAAVVMVEVPLHLRRTVPENRPERRPAATSGDRDGPEKRAWESPAGRRAAPFLGVSEYTAPPIGLSTGFSVGQICF